MKNTYKWIRGGRIVNANENFLGEILVGNGKILALGRDLQTLGLSEHSIEEVDASGLYLFPGGIDAHTHLDLPFMGTVSSDNFETGTHAALLGGTTSIIDFAIQEKGHSFADALNQWHEKAAGKTVTDYSFHIAVTDYNDKTDAELPDIISQGITSFKCFLAYKGALMIDDGSLYRLLLRAKELGVLISLHAENGDLIDTLTSKFLKDGKTDPHYHEKAHPAEGEGEATHRAITLSRLAGQSIFIVHRSIASSA